MTSRKTYVYLLVVDIPPELAWPWEPPFYHANHICDSESCTFSWPARRRFLSLSAAQRRAEQMREWGAAVSIHRSEPVQWGPVPEVVSPEKYFAVKVKQAVEATKKWLQ